jgi:SAM-dependent methyltransferase
MKEFWDAQALKHGEELCAVNFDPLDDRFGESILKEFVAGNARIADLGCGNGRSIVDLAILHPSSQFFGYDYSEKMIEVADAQKKKLGLSNVQFSCYDATSPSPPLDSMEMFDLVIGKRILINIKGKIKSQVVANIYKMLRARGLYVMIECFEDPLNRINEIRRILSLSEIRVREFNEYLDTNFVGELSEYFVVERVIDIGSLYYFISRVFNAYLSEGEPNYLSPLNQLAARLAMEGIQPMHGYAPEIAHILRKR